MPILFIAVVFGVIGAVWAKSKNLNPAMWGIICFLLPALGLILLAIQKAEPAPAPSMGSSLAPGLLPNAGTAAKVTSSYDATKWNALVEYDADIKAANDAVAPYGARYVQTLATQYFILNDKSYLPAIQAKVLAAIKDEAGDGKLADLSEADVRASGKVKDVAWTYYGDNFYIGEREGIRKRFATIDDLKAFFGV